jgi:hypothetical protein
MQSLGRGAGGFSGHVVRSPQNTESQRGHPALHVIEGPERGAQARVELFDSGVRDGIQRPNRWTFPSRRVIRPQKIGHELQAENGHAEHKSGERCDEFLHSGKFLPQTGTPASNGNAAQVRYHERSCV